MTKLYASRMTYKDILLGRMDEAAYEKVREANAIPPPDIIDRGEIVYVTAFTPDYGPAMKRLADSLIQLGLPLVAFPMKPGKDWYENVRRKPIVLSEALEEAPNCEAVCWLDADGEMLKFPELLYNIPTDIAFHWLSFKEPIAAMIYVKNNAHGKKLLQSWRRILRRLPAKTHCPEQKALSKLMQRGIEWAQLPWEYATLWNKRQPRMWAVFRHERWGRNEG